MPPISPHRGVNFRTVGQERVATSRVIGQLRRVHQQRDYDFLIVAWAVFMMVKSDERGRHAAAKSEPATPEAPPPPEDVLLLREIRDSLASMS